jgi:hypothetical protein
MKATKTKNFESRLIKVQIGGARAEKTGEKE